MADLNKYKDLINKAFGKGSATLLSDVTVDKVDAIPTGVEVIDKYAFGCGGFPLRRVTELYSPEGGGKSSLAIAAMSQAQKMGAMVVLCETEQALPNAERFSVFNVDTAGVLTIDASCIEDVMEKLESLLDAKAEQDPDTPMLFIWDSLAQTPTRGEIENGLGGKQKVADRAKFMSLAMRSLVKRVAKANCAAVIINQTRQNIGVVFGNNVVTPGGDAVKFASSLRVQIMGGAAVKEGTIHVGKDITVYTDKNRHAPPSRKVRVRINYETGWDNEWSLLAHCKECGLVKPRQRSHDWNYYYEVLDANDWDPIKVSKAIKEKENLDD